MPNDNPDTLYSHVAREPFRKYSYKASYMSKLKAIFTGTMKSSNLSLTRMNLDPYSVADSGYV